MKLVERCLPVIVNSRLSFSIRGLMPRTIGVVVVTMLLGSSAAVRAQALDPELDGFIAGAIHHYSMISTPIGAGHLLFSDPNYRVNTVEFRVAVIGDNPAPASIFWSLGQAPTVYEPASLFAPGHPIGEPHDSWVFGFDGGRGVSPVTALPFYPSDQAELEIVTGKLNFYTIRFPIEEMVVPTGSHLAVGRVDSVAGTLAITNNFSAMTLSFNGSSLFFHGNQAYPIDLNFVYTAPVPEPAIWLLWAIGMIVLVGRKAASADRRHEVVGNAEILAPG